MTGHPIVHLAMRLITPSGSAMPSLSRAGLEQLGAALRRYRGTPDMQEAALALLGFASFLAAEGGGPEAAQAIGKLVAAEAHDELVALGDNARAAADRRADAGRKLFSGAKRPSKG